MPDLDPWNDKIHESGCGDRTYVFENLSWIQDSYVHFCQKMAASSFDCNLNTNYCFFRIVSYKDLESWRAWIQKTHNPGKFALKLLKD